MEHSHNLHVSVKSTYIPNKFHLVRYNYEFALNNFSVFNKMKS